MDSSSHLVLSLVLAVTLLAAAAVVEAETHPADAEALESFKRALDAASIPPSSCLATWDFAHDPCDSSFGARFTCGLRCDAADPATGLRRVTDLTLDPAGYSGGISPSLASLPFLSSLSLSDNQLSGPIPPLPLPLLRRLSLSRNSLTGTIPDTLSPSLEELYLDGNLLSGPIPAALSNLTHLQRLELQRNNLTNSIPDLTALQELNFLDASQNSITGQFTGLPSSLIEVLLRENKLQGELHGDVLGQLTSLQVLDLSKNQLTGLVPGEAFRHPSLEQLALEMNELEALEEPGVGMESRLIALELGGNRLSGLLPRFLGEMPRLTAVDLRDNMFTGMLPAEYAMRAVGVGAGEGVVPFERLLLSGNYLFGPIPSLMGGMKEGAAVVSLADNCLFRCPAVFFFCDGGEQKTPATCRLFNPVIP